MLKELIHISIFDILQLSYYKIFNINYSTSARWFLIHSIVNFVVVYYSIEDVYNCLINSLQCYSISWNLNSYKVYNYATMLHIYHCLFFKLNKDDILHHFLMVAICGTLCYKIGSIISSFALFFLSGLPGAIDYLLLYLVKMNILESIFEKKIYTLLSAYIRAPGCTYTFAIGMNGVFNYYNIGDYKSLILLMITISLIFWNGQYYFMKSHESYLRKV